jgi:hypothetical protein
LSSLSSLSSLCSRSPARSRSLASRRAVAFGSLLGALASLASLATPDPAIAAPAPAPRSRATVALAGLVVDARSGAPIDTAVLLVDAGDSAATEADGSFALLVSPATRRLTVVAPGYRTRVVPLSVASRDAPLRISLEPDQGSEVITVEGKAPEQTRPTSYQLTAEDIRRTPGAGNDVLRAVQSLPGVARIPYNFGGLVLRGQSPRDSSVFLDGIEVPIAFHFGGVSSFYPASILEDLKITNGGFDVGWGRTQGGVIALATREARTDGWRAGGEVGLLHSGALAEGPLPGGGGVMIGVRRSYFDALAAPFVADDIPLPSYFDAQVRASWGDPRGNGRIIPQVFTSIDRISSNEISLTSGFVRAGVTYRKTWGPLHLEAVPWGGWNGLTLQSDVQDDGDSMGGGDGDSGGGGPDDNTAEFRRPTYVMGLRADLLRDLCWGHLRAGLDAQGGHLGQIEIEIDDATANAATSQWWLDIGGYAEARWQSPGNRFAVKPGVRLERYGGSREWVLDPRLNLSMKIAPGLQLRQAIGRFHQQPTPMELEPTLGNPKMNSAYTDQLSLGLEAQGLAGLSGLDASLTGFWHYGRRQPTAAIRPGPDPDIPEPNTGGLGPIFLELLEEQFGTFDYREATARARSRGIELSLRRRTERWLGFLGYTIAQAERTDDPTRFASGWRPYQLDQTHHLTLVGSYSFTRWRVGGRLTVVSGNPYSPFLGRTDEGEERYDVYAARLPFFAALDLRADRSWKRSWGEVVFYIDIQNATNRHNIEGRELDGERQTDLRGLPFLPFLGVEILPRP